MCASSAPLTSCHMPVLYSVVKLVDLGQNMFSVTFCSVPLPESAVAWLLPMLVRSVNWHVCWSQAVSGAKFVRMSAPR